VRLITWPEVHRHLAATYADVVDVGADAFALVVPARGVPIGLEVLRDVPGGGWVKVLGRIGSLRHLSQVELLANNASATIGAFATRDGELVVRQLLPLPGLRVEDLDETLRDVAELTEFSRRRMAQMGVPAAPWRVPGGRGR